MQNTRSLKYKNNSLRNIHHKQKIPHQGGYFQPNQYHYLYKHILDKKNKKSHPWDSQHKNSPIFRTYNNIIYIIINIYIPTTNSHFKSIFLNYNVKYYIVNIYIVKCPNFGTFCVPILGLFCTDSPIFGTL